MIPFPGEPTTVPFPDPDLPDLLGNGVDFEARLRATMRAMASPSRRERERAQADYRAVCVVAGVSCAGINLEHLGRGLILHDEHEQWFDQHPEARAAIAREKQESAEYEAAKAVLKGHGYYAHTNGRWRFILNKAGEPTQGMDHAAFLAAVAQLDRTLTAIRTDGQKRGRRA